MTIRERFAKYSTEELKNALAKLEAKMDEQKDMMEAYKDEGNSEFYQIARYQHEDTYQAYMDVRCAYLARLEG